MGVVLALAMQVSCSLAQNAAPRSEYSYRVAGHIVSAVDGHPLQRATVQLLNDKQQPEAYTVADEDGSFVFASVKAGLYLLQGSAHGYVSSLYEEHDGYSTGIVTGGGVDTESLVLNLTPESELSGRVTDEFGDPVRRANMALYRENISAGETRTTRVGGAQTDDLGEYEIGHLQPGRYYLSATATPWYAIHPQPAGQEPARPTNAIGVVDSINPSLLDVAYATTFYPDGTDSSAADAIPLSPGEQRSINLRMYAKPAVTVILPRGDVKGGFQFLLRKVFDDLEPVSAPLRVSSTMPTEYAFTAVPPGEYVVKPVPSYPGANARMVNLNLNAGGAADVEVKATDGQEMGNVKVLMRTSAGENQPSNLRFSLVSLVGHKEVWFDLNEKGEAEIGGILPGDYSFQMTLGSPQHYVKSVSSGDQILPDKHVHVVAGETVPVTVVLGIASGKIRGFAKKDGRLASGAMLLLLRTEEIAHPEFFRLQQSDLDGSFWFSDIPPGKYTLLAIEDGWNLQWRLEGALSPYLTLGTSVIVPDSGATAIKLSEPVTVQERVKVVSTE
ncbi:MAG: carboxypeptidase-like regulatory domain-containing protein [Acidobacteriaceae bacterium]|nr:carboxypeptidase-like regulatory domain-containing protein [Acidobacteriaceae bacterium]